MPESRKYYFRRSINGTHPVDVEVYLIECFSEHFIFFKSDKRFKSYEGFCTLKMDPFSDRAPKIWSLAKTKNALLYPPYEVRTGDTMV